jgi:selenocysteine lyase/cysteine desulfurase
MLSGMRFANAIGQERIYARIHTLARRAFDRASKLPYIELLTPNDDRMFASLVTIGFKKDASAVWAETSKRRIFVSGGQRVRLSAHIHTRPGDIDELFDIIEEKLGRA